MNMFSQYSIVMPDNKMIEDSPMQNPLRFLPKRKQKTHSVIRALVLAFPVYPDPSPEGPDRLRDLDNVQDVMEEVLSRLTKFGDSDQVHIWKEDLFREKDVTKEHVLQWYEKLRTQYGTRFEGHEACVKQVPAYMVDMDALPQSMAITSCGWCTR